MSRAALAYAQVRLQARHGMRASEVLWQPLVAISEYRPFLEQARGTSLQRWVSNISPISPVHEVEQRLRGEFRRHVADVADWVPKPLQPAVRWTGILIDLPIIDYLMRGEPLIGWMLEDEHLKPIAAADPQARAATLARSVYAPLAKAKGSWPERWLKEWQQRLNSLSTRHRQHAMRLVRSLRAHLDSMSPRIGEEPMPARAAASLRKALEQRFRYHFRAGFLEPAGVFAFLMLEALEFERLRGELLSRRVFARGGAT